MEKVVIFTYLELAIAPATGYNYRWGISMYKVLIAEDEMLVRMGIKSIVKWQELDMEVIGDVSNGEEALRYFADNIPVENHPDLLITDIKMPLMDGMKLIEEVKKRNSFCKFIVLTCLDEFELARKAVKMQVLDYILKFDMTADSIEAVLKSAKQKMDAENVRNKSSDDRKKEEIQLKILLKDYVLYQVCELGYLKQSIESMKYTFYEQQICVAKLQINYYDSLRNDYQDKNGGFVNEIILNILEELISGIENSCVVEEKFGDYLLFFSDSSDDKISFENKIREFIFHVVETIDVYLNIPASCGVSRIGNGYESLRVLFKESCNCLCSVWFYDNERIVFWENLSEMKCTRNMQVHFQRLFSSVPKKSPIENEKVLKTYVCTLENLVQDRVRILKLLQDYFQEVLKNNHWKMDMEKFRILLEDINQCDKLSKTVTVYEAAIKKYLSESVSEHRQEIQIILDYIQEHYKANINLNDLAKMAGYSNSYLSAVFKKECGTTISDYINSVRISKAKELLRETEMYSYNVAKNTGFTDESYFGRIFKKYTGMSPDKYRRSNSGDYE
jgi:two-component system response regulator YesN